MGSIEEADVCTVRRIESEPSLAEQIHSLIRFGSFERGDFIPGQSDLDYFVVFEDDESIYKNVESLLGDCTEATLYREIDLAWEYHENLSNPYDGVPYKFLTIYQTDFRRHHTLVYGTDICPELPRYDFSEELPRRLDRMERLLAENEDDRMLRFLAGECARLQAVLDGAPSLRKRDVLATLEDNGRTEAYELYRRYADGEVPFEPRYYRLFIEEQVARMRTQFRNS